MLTGLNVFALALSSILSWHFLKGGSMAGCGGGSPCDLVLSSHWSMIAGVLPVSGLALSVYLAMLVAGFFIGPATEPQIRRLAWKALLLLSGSIAGSAVWFTIIQKWIVGDFCIYCMTTHVTGLLLTALIIWRAVKEFNNNSGDVLPSNTGTDKKASSSAHKHSLRFSLVITPVLIGLVFACILAISQIGFTSPAIYHKGESANQLPGLDYHNIPIIGSPDAPYIVTLLFDYECPHCQKVHSMLNDAVRQYNGKLAFALCPTPLNTQCNPYIPRDVDEFKNSCELAKIGLAVWIANHQAFTVFDNWMYKFESGERWRPRSLEAARAKAIELVGQAKFESALTNAWIGQYIQTCVRIFGQTMQGGNGGVPKLIFGSRWVIPQPNNQEDFVKILQNILGVPKP